MTTIRSPVVSLGPSARTAAVLVSGGAFAGIVAGNLVTSGRPALVLVLALAVVGSIYLWERPALGPVLVVGAALTIDQFPHLGETSLVAATARIPLFHGLGGYRPSDLLLGLLLTIAVAKGGTKGVCESPRSPLAKATLVLLVAVSFGVVLGVGTGGIAPVAANEARPFVYLVLAFLITARTIGTRGAIRPVLWALVIGAGFKAVQGVLLFLQVRHLVPRPDAVLGHEESLFFALFMLLTLALWLYDLPGPLRTTATTLFPVVLAADLGNGRRAAWLVLPSALLIAVAVGFVSLPSRRRFLGRVVIGLTLVSVFYFPLYWSKTGGLAQPARALHSALAPNPRDASSDLYRIQEDQNLRYNIRLAGPLGTGFGHRIDYALPIVDISDIDPYIAYVPHNGVWYLFLRLGVLGTTSFWALLGLGIIAGCRLARCPEKELAIVGMLLASALPAYAILGYTDQGFFFYRVAFVMGALLGLGEAARRLAADHGPGTALEAARSGTT